MGVRSENVVRQCRVQCVCVSAVEKLSGTKYVTCVAQHFLGLVQTQF